MWNEPWTRIFGIIWGFDRPSPFLNHSLDLSLYFVIKTIVNPSTDRGIYHVHFKYRLVDLSLFSSRGIVGLRTVRDVVVTMCYESVDAALCYLRMI